MRGGWLAATGYAALAVLVTWPLARGLQHDVAWDLGDPLLVIWALAWDSRQILSILSGDISHIGTFFDGNIFHPASLALAHSEHLVGQAVQMVPVQALTGNPILGYNLLFLSTFALSGLGMFLLVRELTGSGPAGFVAGLIFGFAPYRFPQSSHLHVLSSQWMPFALYGIRRYFTHRQPRALLGAAAAVAVQGLSSGYHLLYFTPFAVAYAMWESVRTGRWRTRTLWLHGFMAAAIVVVLVVPFLLPYLALETTGVERHREEVVRFSADVYSYGTAFRGQPVWGPLLQTFPKPEGDLFLGIVPVALAIVGLTLWRRAPTTPPAPSPSHEQASPRSVAPRLAAVVGIAAVVHLVAAALVLVERRVTIDLGIVVLRMGNINQLLLRGTVLGGLYFVLAPGRRSAALEFLKERGYFLAALLTAAWLSLGPQPQALGRPLELLGVYGLLLDYVPGYNGLRVPARFVVIVSLMLAVLAGFGAARLARWRGSRVILAALSLVFLAESRVDPFVVNGAERPEGYLLAEPRVFPPDEAPPVYRRLLQEPLDAVLVELPIGVPDFDLRAVYYASTHWRRLVNGYSGFFPPHYARLALALSDVPRHPDPAWDALREVGATHVIVHEHVFLEGGAATSAVLRRRGATELLRSNGDVLFRLREQP